MEIDVSDLRKRFGLLVAGHRKRRGYTQECLAAAANISVDMVARIEGGTTGARFVTIVNLANALGVDPAEMFAVGAAGQSLGRPLAIRVNAMIAGCSDKDLQLIADLVENVLKRR